MNADLRCSYLGLTLRNPLVVAASPLTNQTYRLRQLEDAGAAAAVLGSLFAEQVDFERALFPSAPWRGEPLHEPPAWAHDLNDYNAGVDSYLQRIAAAKAAVQMPIIASINATQWGDWVDYARLIQQVGADALELNIYFVPTSMELSGDEVEDRYIELVAAVRSQVTIPLAVKIGPYFSSLPHMARRLAEAGADGLVLFNRFLQPDINLERLEVAPQLELSRAEELRLPLRWIGILYGQIEISMAASTGLQSGADVAKLLLAGADVTMLASVLLRHGPSYLGVILAQLTDWLDRQGCASIEQIQGLLSRHRCSTPGDFERADYAQALLRFTTC
jgi:dihydroorotate dehydrogenase (fumarate)